MAAPAAVSSDSSEEGTVRGIGQVRGTNIKTRVFFTTVADGRCCRQRRYRATTVADGRWWRPGAVSGATRAL
eukprot:7378717-Prymnesium_polylepis.2